MNKSYLILGIIIVVSLFLFVISVGVKDNNNQQMGGTIGGEIKCLGNGSECPSFVNVPKNYTFITLNETH